MANSADSDQMLHKLASDLDLHCLLRPHFLNRCPCDMGRAMQKCVFGLMRIAKSQISLPIRAVWSAPLLSANRIIGYYRMLQWTTIARMRPCACAEWCESTHFAHAQRHFFLWHGPYNPLLYRSAIFTKKSKKKNEKTKQKNNCISFILLVSPLTNSLLIIFFSFPLFDKGKLKKKDK